MRLLRYKTPYYDRELPTNEQASGAIQQVGSRPLFLYVAEHKGD